MQPEAALDYKSYWRPETFDDRPVTRAFWDDPLPTVQGMLTSEHLAFYDDAVGGMICPFNRKLLKPASYELTLGWRCMVEGKDRRLSEKEPWLEIPPNSIAFVSMQQVLRLPHYIVGRFDLAIDFIYEGLLLGTGPQVDPGFRGALGCPLHNISDDSIYIRLGQPFAKMDFVKTAPALSARRRAVWRDGGNEEADITAELRRKDPPPSYLEDVKLFKDGDPKWREPIYDYVRGKRPRSSVAPLKAAVQRLQRYGVLGLVTLALTAGTFFVLYVEARTNNLARKETVAEQRAKTDSELEQLRDQVRDLRRAVRARP
jgi:deoxycytidine triphosphate deaminase